MTQVFPLLAQFTLALQSGGDGTFWMPPRSSTVAESVDSAFYFIYWISVFFFVGIVAAMVLFVIRYRAKSGRKRKKAPHHNLALELTWTIIPLILVIAIFWWNFKTFANLENPPRGAYEINVTAQKWKWLFTYANGYVTEELHVPAGMPVKLVLRSEDVIHSFYVPDFRIKKDVVPGRFNKVWFEAPEPGEHWILCAEYCGTSHSDMLARLIVHDPQSFEDWLAHADDMYLEMPMAESGQAMFERYGCVQCHSVDGTAGTGPTLKDVFNHEQAMTDGTTVLVDEDYIRESIVDPEAKVVAGYQPVMPTFQGKIKEEQIAWIIAYLKTISEHSPQSEIEAAQSVPEPAGEEGAEGEDQSAEEGETTAKDTAEKDQPAPDDSSESNGGEQGEE
ncbi:MAG TPA: cytochrome c oxidase subunit II [Firmicutes bacterium]|nr:cytochrome c oxidase subunit II [Bacillota bacterium]